MKLATGRIPEKTARLALALIAGAMFWTWINLFHDVGRGCADFMIDAQLDGRPFGTYLNCLASPLGMAAGSLAAFVLNQRGVSRRKATAQIVLAGCAMLQVAFYLALSLTRSYLATSAFSLLATALGALFFLRFALGAFDIDESDVAPLAIICFASMKMMSPLAKELANTAGGGPSACSLHLVFLALFAAAFAFGTRRARRAGAKGGQAGALDEPICGKHDEARDLPWSLFVHLVCYATGFGIVHGMRGFADSTGLDLAMLGFLEIPLATALIALCLHEVVRTETLWQRVRGAVFPVVVISYSLVPISLSPFIPSLVAELAGSAYDALFILGCLLMARETRLSLALVASLGCFFKSAGFFLGILFGYLFGGEGFFANQTSATLMFIAVFVVFCAGTFWIGSEQSMRKWWGLRREMTPERYHVRALEAKCARMASEHQLSPREEEMLVMLLSGKRAAQIKDECSLSLFTVRNHIQSVYRKLDVHSLGELEGLAERVETAAPRM